MKKIIYVGFLLMGAMGVITYIKRDTTNHDITKEQETISNPQAISGGHYSHQNGYRVVTGTTLINEYKLPQSLELYGDFNEKIASYSGHVIAYKTGDTLVYQDVQLSKLDILTGRTYKVSLPDNNHEAWADIPGTLTLSSTFGDPGPQDPHLIVYRESRKNNDYPREFCTEQNDTAGMIASDPVSVFIKEDTTPLGYTGCMIYREYHRDPQRPSALYDSRHALSFVTDTTYYHIVLYNYSIDEAQSIFGSLKIL